MPLRIAMISEHASPLSALGGVDSGGQNVYVGQVARQLAAAGHRVDIFTRREREAQPAIVCLGDGVRVVHVPAGPAAPLPKERLLQHMPAFTAFMLDFCRGRAPYDLVHANFFMSGLVACELKRELALPFVITFHALGRVRRQFQGTADGFPDERFAIEDRIVTEADRIIAECPQDEEDLIRLYDADPERISVVPCGFDGAELHPLPRDAARAALGLATSEPIVLQVGRLVPRKGVDTVVRGVARLRQRHGVAARLVIVGGESTEPDPERTPEIGRLQRIAADEGIAGAVTFTGRRGREALKQFYSAADLFVTTPWYEPFGITPVEAMACGAPVIGSNVGGIKFSVRDGETGYLVPPNDPDALARRMADLLGCPKLLALFRRNAVRRVNEAFTWRGVAASLAAIYAEVCGGRRPAPCHAAPQDEEAALIDAGFAGTIAALQLARHGLSDALLQAAETIATCFARGGKLLICGNGGSAAEAQHFVTEFVGRFKCHERGGLPAIALTADSAVLTAWANDCSFDDVFARQVEALGRRGDVLAGLSTSGRSRNVVRAFEAARRRGMRTIALLGGDGGELRELADLALVVPAADTQRVQEVQSVLVHLLCELVERRCVAAGADQGAVPALQPISTRRNGHPPRRDHAALQPLHGGN